MIESGGLANDDALRRIRLLDLLAGIDPVDEAEGEDIVRAARWIASGDPLYRVRKPDVPATHLVSYVVALDESTGELLLAAHRGAGLWLPTGGHVEPAEDPWHAAIRECREELSVPALPSQVAGDQPFFVSVTDTRGAGSHVDVSLWYVVAVDRAAVTSYDEGEFAAVRWLTPAEVLAEPIEGLDPQLHRFAGKLTAALARLSDRPVAAA